MSWLNISAPRISDHGSEIILLGLIAGGVIGYMVFGVGQKYEIDEAACLVVLTMIVNAIKERWMNRSIDRMGDSLANSPAAKTNGEEK